MNHVVAVSVTFEINEGGASKAESNINIEG